MGGSFGHRHAVRGAPLRFDAPVQEVRGQVVVRLPDSESRKLPSRGQVAVHGTLNGHKFQTVLEPDGRFGHWMRIDEPLQQAANVRSAAVATVDVEPAREWPEPSVPRDLRLALKSASADVQDLWRAITPMARWEWVRWVNATRNSETRARRIDVSISKLSDRKRRPCCFNLAACTDPALSKSGKLVLD